MVDMHHRLLPLATGILLSSVWLVGGPVCASAADDHASPAAAHADESAGGTAHHGETASGHADHGGVDYDKPPIFPNPAMVQLFVFSLVLFGLFLLASRVLLWKPLIAALDEREGRINVAYAEAETAKAEAARLLAAHDAKMTEVHEQVKAIVAQARQQADAEKARIIASAEAEAQALRDRALADIRQAREEALAGLAASVDRQVGLATEHILGHRWN